MQDGDGCKFMGTKMRLDKYLADMSVGTRTEVKQMIKKGLVVVNEQVEKKPERKVDQHDKIVVSGTEVSYIQYEYLMLNKPAGVVSATEDNVHKTVLDCIESKRNDLFPVGRLDIDTEGLLLLTNDGELAHKLLSPKKHVPKTYYAKIQGIVTEDEVEQFKQGLDLGDFIAKPAKLIIKKAGIMEADTCYSEIEVTICEGKFHQVKRMFEAVGMKVVFLKRISMGNLLLDSRLNVGEFRPLTEEERRMIGASIDR